MLLCGMLELVSIVAVIVAIVIVPPELIRRCFRVANHDVFFIFLVWSSVITILLVHATNVSILLNEVAPNIKSIEVITSILLSFGGYSMWNYIFHINASSQKATG